MQFGSHTPASATNKRPQSALAAFTRGLQLGGRQWRFVFPNGYGASVINDGYGGDAGLYELAVLDGDRRLTYDTPITDDVVGHLTEAEVAEHLDRIAALPVEVSA